MAAYEDAMNEDEDSTVTTQPGLNGEAVTTQPGLNGEPVMTSEEADPNEDSKKSTVESPASNSTASTAIPLPAS